MLRPIVLVTVLFALVASLLAAGSPAAASVDYEVLIFHKTEGFRHGSIGEGIDAIEAIGTQEGFSVADTADAGVFTDTGLAGYAVVVFLSTTKDVLNGSQEAAFRRFVEGGGGFVGIHAAADTEYGWAWYEDLIGAYFNGHPKSQTATVNVTAPNHPVMEGIPSTFERFDEWFNYRNVPGPGVTVLATLDESTYTGGTMGNPHPIVWAHENLGGRAAYTGFGHHDDSFSEPLMRTLIANAIRWAAGPASDSGTFTDDDGSVFEADIEWLAAEGITKGCNPPFNTRFCPDAPVTRGQLAAFLSRALDLPDASGDPFVDDDDSVFERDIEKLAAAGITRGCNPPSNTKFCPDDRLSRGQMAALLVRAFGYTDSGAGDLFEDDDDSIFEQDIDRLATAGVTRGCNPPQNTNYCPDATVTRAQMAAFFHRALP